MQETEAFVVVSASTHVCPRTYWPWRPGIHVYKPHVRMQLEHPAAEHTVTAAHSHWPAKQPRPSPQMPQTTTGCCRQPGPGAVLQQQDLSWEAQVQAQQVTSTSSSFRRKPLCAGRALTWLSPARVSLQSTMTALLNMRLCVPTRALNKLYRTGRIAAHRLRRLDRLELHGGRGAVGNVVLHCNCYLLFAELMSS